MVIVCKKVADNLPHRRFNHRHWDNASVPRRSVLWQRQRNPSKNKPMRLYSWIL
jgi:hypothetical protein